MAKTITITNLVGTQPFQIYLCDSGFTSCIYFDEINNGDIPKTILVPLPLESFVNYGVLALDANGCEIKQTITV